MVIYRPWKRAVDEEALRLFALAGEKYAAALVLKPDYGDALYNWASLLSEQARRAIGEEASRLLDEAEEKLIRAAKERPDRTYNLACLAALRGNEAECRRLLEEAEKHRTLPDSRDFAADPDLESIRAKPWFQEMINRQRDLR